MTVSRNIAWVRVVLLPGFALLARDLRVFRCSSSGSVFVHDSDL